MPAGSLQAGVLPALLVSMTLLLLVGMYAAAPACARPETTRAAKIRLMEKLKVAPDLYVFGSSRAMKADPRVVRRLTGARGFNAAVSSGTPADVWAFMQLAHELHPDTQPRYLWILDMEQLRRSQLQPKLLTVPRLVAYLPEQFRPAGRGSAVVGPPAEALPSDDDALGRTWSKAGETTRALRYGKHMVFRGDGYVIWGMRDYWASRGFTLEMCLSSTVMHFRAIYPKGFQAIRRTPAYFVRESIRQMNTWGVRPVIILAPYHPQLRSAISGQGWAQRHREVRRFFGSLHRQVDFVFLDFTSIKAFHGQAAGFFDGIHPRRSLAAKMLRAAVRYARTDLTPLPAPTPTPTPTPVPTPTPTVAPAPLPSF